MSELQKFAKQGGGEYPRQCPRYPNPDNVRETLPRTMSKLEKFAKQGGGVSQTMSELGYLGHCPRYPPPLRYPDKRHKYYIIFVFCRSRKRRRCIIVGENNVYSATNLCAVLCFISVCITLKILTFCPPKTDRRGYTGKPISARYRG